MGKPRIPHIQGPIQLPPQGKGCESLTDSPAPTGTRHSALGTQRSHGHSALGTYMLTRVLGTYMLTRAHTLAHPFPSALAGLCVCLLTDPCVHSLTCLPPYTHVCLSCSHSLTYSCRNSQRHQVPHPEPGTAAGTGLKPSEGPP